MMSTLIDWFGSLHGWLFQTVVQPLVYQLDLAEFVDEAYEGTEWFLIGLLELAVLFAVLRPLESWIPVHQIKDKWARWNDFTYTCVQRLGLVPILLFFTLDPAVDALAALLRFEGVRPFNLENLLPENQPLVAFFVYLLVLDFFDYWYHRAEHHFHWWWGLHSLHHSQRNMNLWSDDRNHLLDDILRDVVMAGVALAIGVPPGQFVLLVSFSRMQQSLQHANVRIHFGKLEWLMVSPRYHRTHHAIGIGHESNGQGTLGGCNFAVLFPIWDILFRTANFSPVFEETGVRDQLDHVDANGKRVPGQDYGHGFWAQQWLGLKRMVAYARHGAPA